MSQIQTLVFFLAWYILMSNNAVQWIASSDSPQEEKMTMMSWEMFTDPQFMNYCNFKLLVKTNYAYKMTFFGQNMQKKQEWVQFIAQIILHAPLYALWQMSCTLLVLRSRRSSSSSISPLDQELCVLWMVGRMGGPLITPEQFLQWIQGPRICICHQGRSQSLLDQQRHSQEAGSG